MKKVFLLGLFSLGLMSQSNGFRWLDCCIPKAEVSGTNAQHTTCLCPCNCKKGSVDEYEIRLFGKPQTCTSIPDPIHTGSNALLQPEGGIKALEEKQLDDEKILGAAAPYFIASALMEYAIKSYAEIGAMNYLTLHLVLLIYSLQANIQDFKIQTNTQSFEAQSPWNIDYDKLPI